MAGDPDALGTGYPLATGIFTLEARVCGPWKHEVVPIWTTSPLVSSLTQGSHLSLFTPPGSNGCIWLTALKLKFDEWGTLVRPYSFFYNRQFLTSSQALHVNIVSSWQSNDLGHDVVFIL